MSTTHTKGSLRGKILVTGAAGFIGYHLCEKLVSLGYSVTGLDNINDYYDSNLKIARLRRLGIENEMEWNLLYKSKIHDNFQFIKMNLEDTGNLPHLFESISFNIVCNLAAQAGVRYSLENPMAYVNSNIAGFVNLLESARKNGVKKIIYASSSSVYGLNKKVPFSATDNVDEPISLYAATKKSNELIAHTYSHLYGIEMIGLRFFTVYGPWGRPDMAMFLFTKSILNNEPIRVFNNGNLSRDFTYIDDIVEGLTATIKKEYSNKGLYSIYNIGNSKPVRLLDFITEIERCTGKEAIKEFLPMQPGDVEQTWADVKTLEDDYGYRPVTSIAQGVSNFIKWYVEYYS